MSGELLLFFLSFFGGLSDFGEERKGKEREGEDRKGMGWDVYGSR